MVARFCPVNFRNSSCLAALEELPAAFPRSFFERDVLSVAEELVGALLIVRRLDGALVGRIVETEAYRGPEDAAAHSYRGRRTPRTEVMFGAAGMAYVFMLYGLHHNFNVVTGQPGEPHAVLIRALEPLAGIAEMARARALSVERPHLLASGPGKLCRALSIDLRHYGVDLTQGELYLAPGLTDRVARSPRVGVDYAGEWAKQPWRFYEEGNPCVSRVTKRSRAR